MKTRMMVSISILLMVSISCQMLTDVLPSGGPNPSSFAAAATSPISVQLTWSSVEGAQKYLIERNDGQTEYFPLGEIPGETTAFEDFLVPSNTQVTYRIKTVTASGTSGGKTVSLTTPQEFPNPLTVAATFDTQNAQSQAIGADGGNVSLTDSKGVRYTLDIPAGALDNEVTFTLTPIEEIQGLPLSGGMTSGVRIEPEGLTFNQSATLSIETSQPDAADEMINMAFAFDGEGSEFHFVPGSSAAGTSAVFKLARPASKPWKMIYVPQTKSYGSGKGTSKDIRDQVKNHAPSKPADNLNQEMAAADDADLLVPLVDVQAVNASDAMLLFWGRNLELQVAGIDDWASFNDAVGVFQQWWEDRARTKNEIRKDEINKREDAIWDELTTNAKLRLEKAAEECKKSPNLADAKKLVKQLLNGKSPFYKKFAEKFNQKYGADALKKIKSKLDKCTIGYKVELTGPDGWVRWSGTICNLEQPFTLYGIAPVGRMQVTFPTQFTPSSATAGFGSQDVTVSTEGCTIHFVMNGPYTVNEKSPGEFEIIWNAATDYIENSCGYADQPVPGQTHFTLQPLDTNACSQP